MQLGLKYMYTALNIAILTFCWKFIYIFIFVQLLEFDLRFDFERLEIWLNDLNSVGLIDFWNQLPQPRCKKHLASTRGGGPNCDLLQE